MAKKTPIDKLTSAVNKILEEYADDVQENIDEITERVGKAGVSALRSESREKYPDGTGEYAKGWKAFVNKQRLYTSVILYNDHFALAHLLENGHAKRGGGRVPGRPHIEPVESELIKQYEQEVLEKL